MSPFTKHYLKFMGIAATPVLLFLVAVFGGIPLLSHYAAEEGTFYAPSFSKAGFSAIKAGDGIEEVYRLVGEPLYVLLPQMDERGLPIGNLKEQDVSLSRVKEFDARNRDKGIRLFYSDLKPGEGSNYYYSVSIRSDRVMEVRKEYVD
ncbi:hypothetical protein [Luteolibacter luteus]|uniref:Uncharacterized protein n=1 Tax=Luteolibacter luteus TaxID=2728835 RepID=A0A858RQJ7_9BACT|nr:hypothetical protein [Luteolibacter luteus]QJE98658.1 hypothetical protein HHL09_23690 [Luteolibacter luteus]